MKEHAELEGQREVLLSQMRLIRSMKRGTLSIRTEKVRRKGQREPALLGPYPLFVRTEGKRTVGRRLHSAEEVAQVREDIAAYERFLGLCKEFALATEQLGEWERSATQSEESVKKGLKSRSSGTRRSRE